MRKIFATSFWVVMAIHVVAFTCVGLFTGRGWGLLVLFLCILGATMIVKIIIAAYARRHPEKRRLKKIIGTK